MVRETGTIKLARTKRKVLEIKNRKPQRVDVLNRRVTKLQRKLRNGKLLRMQHKKALPISRKLILK